VQEFCARTDCSCGGYKLVFMDIDMPEMTGLEATQVIRRLSHPVPIVAVSAFSSKEDIEACFQAGMNDYGTLATIL
jgi:CheY-like chemotaxis protein